MRTLRTYGIVALALIAAACLAAAWKAQSQYRDMSLRADSLVAAADTARQVYLRTMADTQRVYQRRVVQVTLERDSVDKELKDRPVVRGRAIVRIDTIRSVDSVMVAADSTYYFKHDEGPFHINTDVRLFGYYAEAVTTLTSDPIDVEVRVGCGDEKPINHALVTISAPAPLRVQPGQVYQDPSVCNPQKPFLAFGSSMKKAAVVAASSIGLWELAKALLKK